MEICKAFEADGFIFLETLNNGFRWEFYNNDGSHAEMCGNATRCIGYYARNILKSESLEWTLQTRAGAIRIRGLSEELFRIEMTSIQMKDTKQGLLVDTGVPHLVIEKKDFVPDEELRDFARALRNHPEFQPKGTNVTFVSFEKSKNDLKAISFERGVEDFTSACGTGAAAAAAYNYKFRGALQTEVEMPGGTLIMDLSDLKKPVMTGPATLLGSYEYEFST